MVFSIKPPVTKQSWLSLLFQCLNQNVKLKLFALRLQMYLFFFISGKQLILKALNWLFHYEWTLPRCTRTWRGTVDILWPNSISWRATIMELKNSLHALCRCTHLVRSIQVQIGVSLNPLRCVLQYRSYCYFETLLRSYSFFSTKSLNLILYNTNPTLDPFTTVQRLLCQQSLLFERSGVCSSLLCCECAELAKE